MGAGQEGHLGVFQAGGPAAWQLREEIKMMLGMGGDGGGAPYLAQPGHTGAEARWVCIFLQ